MNKNETAPCNCGHIYCKGVKSWQIDPYAEEIHGVREWVFICGGTYHEYCMDI